MPTNNSIPPNVKIPKTIQFAQAFIPGASCQFCDRPAEPGTKPALCIVHVDLVIILSILQKSDLEINLENAAALLRRGLANNGQWAITEDQLPALFSEFFN